MLFRSLSTPTGISTTATSNVGFSASWSAVTGATGYSIKTYIGTNLVKTTPVSSGTSATVSGLMSGLDYNYTVIALGDGTTSGNSPETTPTSFSTTGKVSSITTDFSDATTWLTPAASVPANGAFPTTSINAFDLNAAALTKNTAIGAKGEVHINRISLDKLSAGANVTLPTITSVAELEIHFAMGTAANSINLKEYNSATNTWSLVGNYTYDLAYKTAGTDQIILVSFATPHTNSKLRIENNTSGSCFITQIIARSSASLPALAAPAGPMSAPTNTSSTGFTANWPSVVTNASGYKVNVYSNSLKTVVTTATVSDPSALSLAIAGLQADSTYLYGVVGLGNGTTYSDGLILMASSSVITNMAAPVASAATNITSNGFTANWAIVNNASSYDVNVYDATLTQVGTTTNVASPALTAAITGLSANTGYTYTVTAKGDGTTHFNSLPSSPISVSTTIGTGVNALNGNSFITASGKTIINSEAGLIQVYNLQGAKMFQAQMVDKLTTNLASGIYLVKFTAANGQLTITKVQIK